VLRELRIRNLAVIEAVTVPFGPGLNILSGETGAGKSILIDALTLLLGERAQPGDAIRTGAQSATIEGSFAMARKSAVPGLLAGHGVGLEDGQLVVRRELVRGGRGRAFLNDATVTLALLERLGDALVELHGQHEHQALLRPGRHLELLDAFGGLGVLRERVRQRHAEWQRVAAERERLRAETQDRAARAARSREALGEIDAAGIQAGEEDGLRDERRRLQSAEKLAAGAGLAYGLLYDEPGAAAAGLGRATAALRDLARLDAGVTPVVQALEAVAAQVDEAVRALRRYRDGLVADPGRLDEIERRLDALARLKRKYGDDLGAVLARRAELAAELDALARAEEEDARLGERLERLRAELGTRALDLAARREQAAGRLGELTTAELAALDLDKAAFRVRLVREPAGPGEPGVGPEGWRLGPHGVEQAEFLFSANPGEEPRPLQKVASGGELSRAMLALRVVLAATDAVPILVFDEVDAGIGGKTADVVGRKLRQAARGRQVLCVTHLPQIAAYADHHLRVTKREEGGRVLAEVAPLARAERVREVARMLGGETVTETSLRHARELIDQARGR
jgi:DNA repair protein RecN (Recombination protein N)